MRYFAFGANCNAAVMKRKGVQFETSQHATLRGYRLRFNKRSLRENLPEEIGFANIEECADGSVEGILYDIVDEHRIRLDESERYPEHYDRIEISVETTGDPVPCFAYKAQPDKVSEGLRPSRNYLNHILAAKDFLSLQYYEALDRSLTYEGDCICCSNHGEVTFIKEVDDLFMLCQPCREARLVWGDVHGRRLTVAETATVMQKLVVGGGGYSSIPDLIKAAVAANLIAP